MDKNLKVKNEFSLRENDLLFAELSKMGGDLQELAEAIGDKAERLERVLDGVEPLGNTAFLALEAVMRGLSPISRDDR